MHRHSPDHRLHKSYDRPAAPSTIARWISLARQVGRTKFGLLSAMTVVAVAAGSLMFSAQERQSELRSTIQPAAATRAGAPGYEVGQKFVLTADARISGFTFTARIPRPRELAVHLWSDSGKLLATGPAAARTTGQRYRSRNTYSASFPQPVALTKGTSFTVSFWASRLTSPPTPSTTPVKRTGPAVAGSVVYHRGPGYPDLAGPVGDYPIILTFTSAVTPSAIPTPTPAPTHSSTPAPTTSVGPPAPANPGGPARSKNCAPKPSACGFPDETNTGARNVSAARIGETAKGKGWHYDTRGWVEVTGDGAVVENLTLSHGLNITGNNVTVRNVTIKVGGEGFGIGVRSADNVTIEDSTISGPDAGSGRLMVAIKDVFSDSKNLRILRNNIYNTSTAVQIDAGLVQDNYIHDLGYKSGDHLNGTTSNATSGQLTLRHNTVLNSFQQTDAISLFEDFGVQKDRIIDNNLMAGGGYTLYGGANPGGPATSNIQVTNNRFSRMYFPNGGFFGAVTAFDPGGSGNKWSGNVWDDTDEAVLP